MNVKKYFLPGSHWLYFKIYLGEGYSNIFLSEKVFPLIQRYLSDGSVYQWFFVRYNDPEDHLRIRILCAKEENILKIQIDFANLCDKLLLYGYISEVLIGTYKREWSRYGINNIIAIEKLWSYESNFILQNILRHKNQEMYLLTMISIANLYLKEFYKTEQEQIEHTQNNFQLFAQEFNLKKDGKRKLSDKFRVIHKKISILLDSNELNNEQNILFLLYQKQFKSFNKELNLNGTRNLYTSLLHMLFNRGFGKSQRAMEMVVYHHLWKYYQSQMARFGKI